MTFCWFWYCFWNFSAHLSRRVIGISKQKKKHLTFFNSMIWRVAQIKILHRTPYTMQFLDNRVQSRGSNIGRIPMQSAYLSALIRPANSADRAIGSAFNFLWKAKQTTQNMQALMSRHVPHQYLYKLCIMFVILTFTTFIPKFLCLCGRDPATILIFISKIILVFSKVMAV